MMINKRGSRARFGAGGSAKLQQESGEGQRLDLSGSSLLTVNAAVAAGQVVNWSLVAVLDLSNNNLQEVPESLIARLLNLVAMDLHSNQLKSLPNSIGCLSKLKILNVSGNYLETLPKTIEDCRALVEINANFNNLTKLPDSMGFELTNLEKLTVNSNKLSFLPSSTSHMTSLRVLDVHLNSLRSLPDGLENLMHLEVLDVSQNFRCLQSLPCSIGLVPSLVELDISYNMIRVLPDSMSCLTKLTRLNAEGNPIVSPPQDVVEQGIQAIREYLADKMNGSLPARKNKSWLAKLVKFPSFSSGMLASNNKGIRNSDEGIFKSGYHSIDGRSTPSYVSMLSPRWVFSPRRNSPKYV